MNLAELMARYLPLPPDPMPEPNSDADYLWRATQYNSRQQTPRRIVEMTPRPENKPSLVMGPISNEPIPIIRVECDDRGRGMRVIR